MDEGRVSQQVEQEHCYLLFLTRNNFVISKYSQWDISLEQGFNYKN